MAFNLYWFLLLEIAELQQGIKHDLRSSSARQTFLLPRHVLQSLASRHTWADVLGRMHARADPDRTVVSIIFYVEDCLGRVALRTWPVGTATLSALLLLELCALHALVFFSVK